MATEPTIDDIKSVVKKDVNKALKAYKDEIASKKRTSLLTHLKTVISDGLPVPKWGLDSPSNDNGARYQMAASTLQVFAATKAYKPVEKFMKSITLDNGKARTYTLDGTNLRAVGDALANAADEVYESSLADFKTMLRASRIAYSQADVANAVAAEIAAKPKPKKAKGKANDDADAIVDETVPF